MTNLLTRLGRLEDRITLTEPQRWSVHRFMIQGPHGMSPDQIDDFLRDQGHDLGGVSRNVVRVIVGAEDGRPVDLSLADLTPRALE